MVAFESSTAMSRFFGETELFEAESGATRDCSRGAVVFMMSPWLGVCRPGSAVAGTPGGMPDAVERSLSYGPSGDEGCWRRGYRVPCNGLPYQPWP